MCQPIREILCATSFELLGYRSSAVTLNRRTIYSRTSPQRSPLGQKQVAFVERFKQEPMYGMSTEKCGRCREVADRGGRVYIGFNETGETFSSSADMFSGFRSPLKLSQNLCCTSKKNFLSW